MKKKILILHTGIPQLINQLAYIYQNNLTEDVLGIIRMYTTLDSYNPELDETEQWIFNLFKIKLLGKTKAIVRVWGNNKFEKLYSFFFLKLKIKRYLKNKTNIVLSEITDIIMPYKPFIDFILITSVFKNVKFHFIAEGTSIDYHKTAKMPFYLKIIGINNIFNDHYNIINTPPSLQNSVKRFGKTQLILEEQINKVLTKIKINPVITQWLRENQLLSLNLKYSLLILQPLDRWLSINDNIKFYEEIIKAENHKSVNKIIVKFHPRETNSNIKRFEKRFLSESNLCYFSNSFLSLLPIEIYFSETNINRIIGYCSTSLLLAKDNNKIEVSMYYCDNYPDKINTGAKRLASELNIDIEKLDLNI